MACDSKATGTKCLKFDPCDCDNCEFAKTHKDGIWAGSIKCVNCREERDKHSMSKAVPEAVTGVQKEVKPKSELPVIYRALKASTIPTAKEEMTAAGYNPIEVPCYGCGEDVLVDAPTYAHATEKSKELSVKPMLTYCHVCVNDMYSPSETIKGQA